MKRLLTSHKLITALFAALFTLTLHNVSNAQTHIYVDAANGINATTGRGAPGKAYKSITYALLISQKSNLPDPWHVHIHPGTYDVNPAKPANEREIFPLKLRSKMIFQGTTTAAECIIDAQHLGEAKTSILLGEDVEDVTIRNLTIQNMQASDGAGGITLRHEDQQAATNSIEACIIHNNARSGVITNTPLVLIGNTFSSNADRAVTTETNIIVTNNIFDNNPGLSILAEDSAIDIDISGNTFDGHGIYTWSSFPVTGNIIRNKFSNGWQGFTIDRGGTLIGDVSHNTFNNNTGGGFSVQYLLTGNVTHNIFTENGASWADDTGGFRVGAMEGNVTHNTFENNTSRGGVGGFSVESRFRGEITHNRFEGNSVVPRSSAHNPRGIAVSVDWNYGGKLPESNIKITNNIFSNNTGIGELTYVVYTDGPAVYANNLFTVVDGLSEGVPVPAVGLFFNSGNPSSPEVRLHNNIFSGMETAIYTEIPDLPITHNLFHNIGLDFVNQDGSGVGDDLDFWELFADGASNNIVAGLLLKDPAHGDFHPLAGSPTIDAGTDQYAPADDFDGAARPIGSAVDIGPYEYKQGATGTTAKFLPEDVNQDGRVNIADLVVVAHSIGTLAAENPRADVNGDGVINIIDLTLVAGAFGKTAAAPAAHATALENLTATEVAQWLQAAQQANLTDPASQRGVEVLKHLLVLLVPKETVLLANYPNPFNPETWIPYQLANPAEVTLRIYAIDGSLVRTLSLGHQGIGIYQSRTRAAYWDGKNEVGEPVASGVYFYTLTAEDFTATRKMLIRK